MTDVDDNEHRHNHRRRAHTVEPPILELANARLAEGQEPWAEARPPLVKDRMLRLRVSGLLEEFPKLAAYVARGEARPAYERPFDAQRGINAL